MLRETLEKMQERIELQQWDNESDPTLLKKMKDLSELYSGWLIAIISKSNVKNHSCSKEFYFFLFEISWISSILLKKEGGRLTGTL